MLAVMKSMPETSSFPFSIKAFLQGFIAVCLLFISLFIFAFFKSDETAARLESRLASKTVLITAPEKTVQHSPSKATEHASTEKNSDDGTSLIKAPLTGLYERTPQDGVLPVVRAEDGMTPYRAYKRPFTAVPGRGTIALAILDVGLSEKTKQQILSTLPPDITLVLSPYSTDLQTITDESRQKGHEVWLNMPLEGIEYPQVDPGPQTLLVSGSLEQKKSRLNWLLSRPHGYAGFVTPPDHAFYEQDLDSSPMFETIFKRGLGIVDTRSGNAPFLKNLSTELDAPFLHLPTQLDVVLGKNDIQLRLQTLEANASRKGYAAAWIYPYPATLQIIQEWTKTLSDRGLQLAPLSVVIDNQ